MRKFLYLLLAILLWGCSANEPSGKEVDSKSAVDSHFVSLDAALKSGDGFFNVVYEKNTRTSGRKPKSVEVFMKPSTRSDVEKVNGLYFVNYDEGFAILSADNRRPAVLAVSDEGSISLADTIVNKGLADYINQIYNYESIASTEDIGVTPVELEKKMICYPMLNGMLASMHQHSPYNLLCRTREGNQAPVGCSPLAIGTLCGYYQFPPYIKGMEMPWHQMLNDPNDDEMYWARLFYIIGSPEYAQSEYTPGWTFTFDLDILNALGKLGFTGRMEYSIENLDENLKLHFPAIVSGSEKNSNGVSTGFGHTFIVDGGFYYGQNYTSPFTNVPEFRITYTYYSVKWGHGGYGNGYYLFSENKFDGDKGISYGGQSQTFAYTYHVSSYMNVKPGNPQLPEPTINTETE